MKCKVSVIVPIYNTQEFLGECLDSIIGQTYKNIEVLEGKKEAVKDIAFLTV